MIADVEAPEAELLPMGSRFSALGAEFELSVPGRHNAQNALAAALACREAGVEPADSAHALRSFAGAGRRFEAHGTGPAGSRVYDDYAHHPTEVRATLEAARTLGGERVVACFQPHLYSRTQRARARLREGARGCRRRGRARRLPRARGRRGLPGRERMAGGGRHRGRGRRAARVLDAAARARPSGSCAGSWEKGTCC